MSTVRSATSDTPSCSRRDILRGAAALAMAPVLGGCSHPYSASVTGERAGLATNMLAIDMHNHVYPAGTEPHPRHDGPRPGQGPGQAPGQGLREEPDAGPPLSLAEALRDSGLNAVCASFVLDFASNERPGDARTNLLNWLTAIDAELAKGHLRRALDGKDLEASRKPGAPTIIQAVEGAHFIEGDLGRIDEVYQRGLRHLQLLHERDDMVSPLGDTNTGVAHLGGLTPVGVEVIKRCNRLGILVDLAHASHETVLGALKIATQPVVVSHTNLDTWTGSNARMAEMMKPRLISKEHAKVIADAGGVIGVWTHLTGSLTELVSSIKAMVDAVGVDHVGIGSDTDLLSTRVGKGTNQAWPGLGTGFFYAVSDEMKRQGFLPGEISKIGGGNYFRVFNQVTAAHG